MEDKDLPILHSINTMAADDLVKQGASHQGISSHGGVP